MEAYTNPIGGSVYVRGLFYDIWQILEAKLNFSTILTKMKDGKSKGWSFIMQTVVEKKHDLFLAGNSLTESRAKILDQSFPIVLTSVRLIYLKQSASQGRFMVSWNSFLRHLKSLVFKCDDLASRTSKDLNLVLLPSSAFTQNLFKNQNLDKQINEFPKI